jgi:hypothetical protein
MHQASGAAGAALTKYGKSHHAGAAEDNEEDPSDDDGSAGGKSVLRM